MTYSVLHEPVIPVRMADGEITDLGIRDVLIRAHEIADLNAETPLEHFSLLRLLAAFVMEIFHPMTAEERAVLLRSDAFDPARIDAYFQMCEHNGPRFDLFDEYHPFMQSTFDFDLDSGSQKPVSKLSIFLPSGNNHMFMDHRMEDEPEMTPAEAFRSMICTYLFCTAGAQGFPSGVNNTTPVYSWVGGKSLHDILVLNSLSVEECAPVPYGLGAVPWRNEDTVVPKQLTGEMSLLEAYTWQPRRIILICEDSGIVKRVIFRQGKNFKGNPVWKDPCVAYRKNASDEWKQVPPLQGRDLWRDLGWCLSDSAGEKCIPPAVFTQKGIIRELRGTTVPLHQVGLVTNQASFGEWMEDCFFLPSFLAEDDPAAGILRSDLDLIEKMQNTLGISVRNCFKRMPGSSIVKELDLADQTRHYFLEKMRGEIFDFSIPDLQQMYPDLSPERIRDHYRAFDDRLFSALLSAVANLIESSGTTAEKIRAQTEVRRVMIFSFNKYTRERMTENGPGKMEG